MSFLGGFLFWSAKTHLTPLLKKSSRCLGQNVSMCIFTGNYNAIFFMQIKNVGYFLNTKLKSLSAQPLLIKPLHNISRYYIGAIGNRGYVYTDSLIDFGNSPLLYL